MDSLERAIRLAFEKGDPGDVDFRKRVYRSAVNAVEKSAATNPNLTAEAAVVRMNRLKDVIRSVESEFHPAQGPAPEASSVRAEPTLDDVAPHAGDRWDAPPAPAPRMRGEERREPVLDRPQERVELDARALPPEAPDRGAADEYDDAPAAKQKPERRIFGLPFAIGLAILVALAVWLYAKYGDAPRPNVTAVDTSKAPVVPGSENDANWITVFDAADPSTVKASDGLTLEVVTRDGTKALRVDAKGKSTAGIMFDVGPGLLRDFAGQRVIFDIAARAQEGANTAIAVECDFGGSDCGRRRYEINFAPGNYLFDVELPESPSGAGTITLMPDTAGAGQPLDVSAIRISKAPDQ